jgi:enoyl-CoA hydratase/carnithine racemase
MPGKPDGLILPGQRVSSILPGFPLYLLLMPDKILYTQHADAPIGVLTFNRPERRNALDREAMQAFSDCIHALADAPIHVLVVTGAGDKAFCSGGDTADLAAQRSADDGAAMSALMGDALLALERLPFPVIAAVSGVALGGGSEIAVACDLRVLDETARLGFVHASRGLIPGWGGGQRLMRLVGYTRALELLATARVLDAREADALGLANQVTPAGGALDAALALAETIAALDKDAIRAAKSTLRAGLTQPYLDALKTERGLFPALWIGETHQRALDNSVRK